MRLAPLVALVVVIAAATASAYDEVKFEGDGLGYSQMGGDVDVRGDYAIIGSYGDNSVGAAYILHKDAGVWTQQAKVVTHTPANNFANFGWSVAISSEYAIVGAPQDNTGGSDSGAVSIFVRTGTMWASQVKFAPSAASSEFGWSVSISGTGEYCFVGARQDPVEVMFGGAVYVYSRSGQTWSQVEVLTPAGLGMGNVFGESVATNVDGSFLAVGASGSAEVYIFNRVGAVWSEQATLTSAEGQFAGGAGSSAGPGPGLAITDDGSRVVVGAIGSGTQGSAVVFARDGVMWSEEQVLTAPNGMANDKFGGDVSINEAGDYIVVGAPENDVGDLDAGTIYVFLRNDTTWTGLASGIQASDPGEGDIFGSAVAISGEDVVVGSRSDNVAGDQQDSGSAYFLVPLCTTPPETGEYCPFDGQMPLPCPDPTRPYCEGGGAVSGDPHIEGFLGQHFIVDGAETADNQVYNMISSPWMQYNARFSRATFLHRAAGHEVPATQTTEIGFSFKASGRRVRVSLPSGGVRNLDVLFGRLWVEVDGERLPTDRKIDTVELAEGVTLDFVLADSRVIQIATPHFLIEVTSQKLLEPHLDCDVKLVDWTVASQLHGLLGQTAHADKAQTAEDEAKGEVLADVFWPWFLDGELRDYHLEGDDVFGTGFVFNKF